MHEEKASSVSFEEIRQLWEQSGEPLYTTRLIENESVMPDETTIGFLSEVGFPEAAEPGLDFTDLTEKLFTHSQLYTRDDFPALDQYLVIGSTSEGNPVCINTKDNSIVYIDHDNGFESVFVNSSIIRFSYFLVRYGMAVTDKETLKTADVDALRNMMEDADPRGVEEHSFWTEELLKLEREII